MEVELWLWWHEIHSRKRYGRRSKRSLFGSGLITADDEGVYCIFVLPEPHSAGRLYDGAYCSAGQVVHGGAILCLTHVVPRSSLECHESPGVLIVKSIVHIVQPSDARVNLYSLSGELCNLFPSPAFPPSVNSFQRRASGRQDIEQSSVLSRAAPQRSPREIIRRWRRKYRILIKPSQIQVNFYIKKVEQHRDER